MSQVHDTPSCRLVGARRSARLLLSLAFAFASLPLCRLARAQGSPTPVLPPPASPARADAAPVAEVSPLALEGGAPSGALTAEIVGRRAAETSYVAKAAQESVRSAAARVDQAWVAFLPRLSTRFSYSRLSEFTPRTFGEGSLVGTPQPAGTPNPTPTQAVGLAFPIVPDNWTLEAQLVVPISDYFLRISQGYSAATKSHEAARHDLVAARSRSATEGKLAYYAWLRARGAAVVAKQSLEAVKTHLRDAKTQVAAGNASRADALRAETAVAGAELALERAANLAELTQKQVAIAMHAKEGEALAPGESGDAEVAPFVGSLAQLVAEAKASRYEIRSIDANAEAARKQAGALAGGAYPSLAGFGTANYSNPNPRRIPLTNEWFGTWALGVQLTWTPNDTYGALASSRDLEARVSGIEAQRGAIRDGIELEVTQAFQSVREADFAGDSSRRQLASAEEAYRTARELFTNGRATSTMLTDAETDLTRARLERLNARIDARVARVRLEHALGRDARGDDR